MKRLAKLGRAAVALIWTLSAGAALAGPPRGDFIRTRGTQFTLDHAPFQFQGTNFYRIGVIDRHTEQEVYDIFQALAGEGIKVVRFWAFSCPGGSNAIPLINRVAPGHVGYDPAALRRLDATLDAANSAGIRVIFPLVNYEPEYCGMGWWTEQLTGSTDKQLFYTDPGVQQVFRLHIENLLNRENEVYRQKYGVRMAYKDDPTIMAIEVANEPHTEDFYEMHQGLTPGALVHEWLRDTTEYIRRLDPNHLISTGEEGYKVSHDGATHLHPWIHDGSKGVDFARNITLPHVSFATLHVYPDNWNIPPSQLGWVRDHIIRDRAAIAHAAGKPIIMEETGFSSDPRYDHFGYFNDRRRFLLQLYRYATDAGYAGTMVWQSVPPNTEQDAFSFDFNDPAFHAVRAQVAYYAGQPAPPAPPPSLPDCRESTDSDPDRIGLGRERNTACLFVYCEDPTADHDRDTWGFEQGHACRVPSCMGPKADPDGDGWGWEVGMSCLALP